MPPVEIQSREEIGEDAAPPQVFTLEVDAGCELTALSQRFQTMKTAGDLQDDPIRVGERFRISTTSEKADTLRDVACVTDVVRGWQELAQEEARPLPQEMNDGRQVVMEGLERPLATEDTGSISGTVTSEATGSPIPGILLCIYSYEAEWGGYSGTCQDVTDSGGHYTIDGLLPGDYRVGFEDASAGDYVLEYYDDAPYLETAVDVSVTSGSITSGIDAALATAGHITGTITADSAGAPLQDIDLVAYRFNGDDWDYAGYGYSDADGYYDVGGLTSGTYRLRFRDGHGDYVTEYYDEAPYIDSATDIAVTAGTTTSGIDAALADAGQITGTVTAEDSGTLLADIIVCARVPNGFAWQWWEYCDYTDLAGQYEIGGIPSGIYHVEFVDFGGYFVPEYYDDALSFDAGTDVTVTSGSTASGIDAALATAAHITGTVTAEAGGAPLADIEVVVYLYDSDREWWTWFHSTSTDASGDFFINSLPAGTYRLKFSDWNGDYVPEYYDDAADLYEATDIAVAAGATAAGKNAALATAAHITGTVTADDGGAPLPDIYVEAYRFNGSGWGYVNYSYTDSSGYYDVGELPAGTYRLGFFDWNNGAYVSEYFNNTPDLDGATDIVVAAGATAAGKNVALATAAHITGTITAEEDGAPLYDIPVRAYRFNGDYWENAGNGYSDAGGYYDVGGLPAGTYRLWFRDWNGDYVPEYYDDSTDLEGATDIVVAAGASAVGKNAALATAAHITGTVTAESGGALRDIHVRAYRLDGSYWAGIDSSYTDENGSYSIGGLLAGTYRVEFYDWNGVYAVEYYNNALNLDSATDITVPAGGTASGKDAALATAAHITGTVTADDGGAPLPDIYVEAYRFNGSDWDYVNYSYTDSSGYYDVGGLPAGTYRLGFFDWGSGAYVSEYFNNAPDLEGATDIVVAAGATAAGRDAALATAAHITGTVTAESGGAPLPDVDVAAYVYDGFDWIDVAYGYTDANGQYDIGGLAADVYRLRFTDYSGAYVQEYYFDAANVYDANDVSVSAGSVASGIDAALTDAGYITGTVTAESDGSPLADIVVWLYRSVASEWVYLGNQWTDDNGWFEFGGLAEGTYRVEYYDWYEVYVGEIYDSAASLEEGTNIQVVPGVVAAGIDASLEERGSIGGTVTVAASGSPLANVDVGAWTFNGTTWDYLKSGYSDDNGDYLITGLQPGVYRVDFIDSESLYQYEFYDDAPDVTSATDVFVVAATTSWGIDAALDLPSASPFTDCISNTGNDATIAVPAAVTMLGGFTLEAGDEFALFTPDGSVCAGHGVWTGGSLGITAWGDDTQTPATDGFVAGQEMVWALWDASANERYDALLVTYSLGDGIYTSNSFHAVGSIDVNPLVTQDIALSSGWNLISSYVVPEDPALETVLAGIVGDMVLFKNGIGQVYWPAYGINQLDNWDVRQGYQLYMNNPATLSITGHAVDPAATPIALGAGWNMAAYLRSAAMPVDQALSSISAELYLAKNGAGQVYWPAYGINYIGSLQPGQGYQVYMESAGTLLYPSN